MRKLDGQASPLRKLLRPASAPRGEHASAVGRIAPGNIDIHHRPRVRNRDGSISTVRSISVGTNPAYLIPTVVGRRVVSNKAAYGHFQHTGQHLGKFTSWQAADRYANQLHRQQARMIGRRP